jgi:hypothetical protein
MPATFDTEIKRMEGLYEAFPEEIEIRPELNGRHDKPDIEWLIADILKRGQIQPVAIWKDGMRAVLALGFSRWRAISEINKRKLTPKPMKLKFTYVKCNEQGAFIRNISENRMRNPTSPIDDAHNIQRLFDWTMDEAEVAKIYFPLAATDEEIRKALKWVRETVNLIKLTPEAERAMRDGRLNETAAQAIAKLSSSQQKEALKKDGKITAADIKANAPKSNRGRKPAESKPVEIDPELRRRITAVVESADWEEYDEKISSFIEVRACDLAALKNYTEEK